jgi:hypothetical protein
MPCRHSPVLGVGINAEKGRGGGIIVVGDPESKMEIPGKFRRQRWKES